MSTSGSRAEAGLAWVSQRLTRKLTQPSGCCSCSVGLGGSAGRGLATELTGDSLWVSLWIGKNPLTYAECRVWVSQVSHFFKKYSANSGKPNAL